MTPWRKMKHAYRDGRHLILRLRKTDDMRAFAKPKRWAGGVLAYWVSKEDCWRVIHDPESFGDGGSIIDCDSHWFTGWKPLPDELYKPPAAPVP